MSNHDLVRQHYQRKARRLIAMDHPWNAEQRAFLNALAGRPPAVMPDATLVKLISLEKVNGSSSA